MSVMQPLLQTGQVGVVEEQLAQLFAKLYADELAELDNEINVYGAPHLGSLALIRRLLTQDGLVVLNPDDDTRLRYLFKAWRYGNPRRGLHFLRKYLQILFGSAFDVEQLWHKESNVYPRDCRTPEEIDLLGEELEDYFLTSRVRVDLGTSQVPERVLRALVSTVSARIVLEIRIARRYQLRFAIAPVIHGVTLCYVAGAVGPDDPPDNAVFAAGGDQLVSGGQILISTSS